MPIAGPSQPRRATTTRLSIDRTRRPVSPRQRTNHPLEPRDRPRTPGPSKADPHRHPPRDRTPEGAKHPTNSTPIHRSDRRRTRASIPERQLDLEAQPSPRCGAPVDPEQHRIRSRVSIELGASSVPSRCRIERTGRRTGRGVLWGSRG
ncbi:hypothetical protein DIMARIA_87 [Mycobacterium phage DiMaria]